MLGSVASRLHGINIILGSMMRQSRLLSVQVHSGYTLEHSYMLDSCGRFIASPELVSERASSIPLAIGEYYVVTSPQQRRRHGDTMTQAQLEGLYIQMHRTSGRYKIHPDF